MTEPAKKSATIRIFGVGNAGISVIDRLLADAGDVPTSAFVAVNTDASSLNGTSAPEKVQLEAKLLRGLGTGGDPDRGRTLAEEQAARFKALCEGVDVVFIVAGLGGGAGTGTGPVLAQAAKAAGALVLGFVMTPFDCEGSRRQRLAQNGIAELKEAADVVISLPNQKVLKLLDENASVLDAFRVTNDLLADGVRGVWRLLALPGLIEIHFDELCAFLRERHTENAFAAAEATGAVRAREVADKLLAHPLLDEGGVLGESEAVLISLVGGPDLTISEVSRVMAQLEANCGRAQVLMGAAIHESFRDRLAVTLVAARKNSAPPDEPAAPHADAEGLDKQLLERSPGARPGSRIVPPAPQLTPEQLDQLMARHARTTGRTRKGGAKMRQAQLPLDIISKGRFDKSEPTIHKGEDLDVPTYLRRGVSLN